MPRNFGGSLIGGIRETLEMLGFCATHGIDWDFETVGIDEIDTAFARMLKRDVSYWFVIDMATLPELASP